jgi:hypothetical protein
MAGTPPFSFDVVTCEFRKREVVIKSLPGETSALAVSLPGRGRSGTGKGLCKQKQTRARVCKAPGACASLNLHFKMEISVYNCLDAFWVRGT